MRKYTRSFHVQKTQTTFSFDQNDVEKTQWSNLKVYQNECFVFTIANGKHYRFATEQVSDTVITAYKILSKKFFYYESHGELVKRLFEIAQHKQKKISKTHGDITISIGIICISSRYWWVGIQGAKIKGIQVKKIGKLEEVGIFRNNLHAQIISGLKSDTKGFVLHTNIVSQQQFHMLYAQLNCSIDKTITQLLLKQVDASEHQSALWVQI